MPFLHGHLSSWFPTEIVKDEKIDFGQLCQPFFEAAISVVNIEFFQEERQQLLKQHCLPPAGRFAYQKHTPARHSHTRSAPSGSGSDPSRPTRTSRGATILDTPFSFRACGLLTRQVCVR